MLSIRSLFAKTIAAGLPDLLKIQARNAFVLKRRWPPPLHKKGGKPSKFRGRHFVYDLEEDTNCKKKDDLKIILNQYVDGIGDAGSLLSLRPSKAYKEFLLPGLAVYATPENLAKFTVEEDKPKVDKDKFSSPYVQRTINCLTKLPLQITMSKLQPWKLEPWHVRASFRKAGFVVPEEAIEMPPREITGPDLSLQDKEFCVAVTINKNEKVYVRCRIHHWATGLDRLPWEQDHWKKPKEPLFPEQASILEQILLRE